MSGVTQRRSRLCSRCGNPARVIRDRITLRTMNVVERTRKDHQQSVIENVEVLAYDDVAVSGREYRYIESSGIGSNLVGHRLLP